MDKKEKLFRKIVNHQRLILAVFLIGLVICFFAKNFVSVNYDMNDYLPEETASTVSVMKMEEEFEGGIPNARVMVEHVTIPQALKIKEEIAAVGGVREVMWLDDVVDLTAPLEIYDQETVKDYYQENAALFTVTIEESEYVAAVRGIREIIGEENAMSGAAVDTAAATESTTGEVQRIVMIAVPFCLLVLLVTTTSYFEPVLLLGSIGIAIILNAGTNIIFGEISFVTNAAGNILQLAVSLDYSVFLLHRFKEIREENPDMPLKEVMVQALCKSVSSVLSSGLTTVIGFLALVLMRFQIGPDMGLALAKGIVFSLITVFVLFPVLTLYCYKLIDKTAHRSFMPPFKKFGGLIIKVMLPFTAVFAVLIVPSYLASVNNSYYYGSSHIFGEETQVGQDAIRIKEVFGKSNQYALLVPKESPAREKELSAALRQIPQVSSIISFVDTVGAEIPEEYLPADIALQLRSDDYSRMIINTSTDIEGEDAFSVVEQIRKTAGEFYQGDYYLAGETVSTYDLMETVTSDMARVNLVAIGAVAVVLLISMKSVSLPVLLVLAIETAIWINLSLPYYTGSRLFYIGYLIISSIQLGATVDYAILLTDRYMEYRETYKRKEAIWETISAVTVSVLTSGSVLTVVGFLLGGITSHGILSQLGYLLGKGTLCSMVIVFFVVPGLLYLFDGLIQKTTKQLRFVPDDKAKKSKEVGKEALGGNV